MPGSYRAGIRTDSTHSMMSQRFGNVFLCFFYLLLLFYSILLKMVKLLKNIKEIIACANIRCGTNT